jgi:hypothetical protein
LLHWVLLCPHISSGESFSKPLIPVPSENARKTAAILMAQKWLFRHSVITFLENRNMGQFVNK